MWTFFQLFRLEILRILEIRLEVEWTAGQLEEESRTKGIKRFDGLPLALSQNALAEMGNV